VPVDDGEAADRAVRLRDAVHPLDGRQHRGRDGAFARPFADSVDLSIRHAAAVREPDAGLAAGGSGTGLIARDANLHWPGWSGVGGVAGAEGQGQGADYPDDQCDLHDRQEACARADREGQYQEHPQEERERREARAVAVVAGHVAVVVLPRGVPRAAERERCAEGRRLLRFG
jgi:hypothetical protein